MATFPELEYTRQVHPVRAVKVVDHLARAHRVACFGGAIFQADRAFCAAATLPRHEEMPACRLLLRGIAAIDFDLHMVRPKGFIVGGCFFRPGRWSAPFAVFLVPVIRGVTHYAENARPQMI